MCACTSIGRRADTIAEGRRWYGILSRDQVPGKPLEPTGARKNTTPIPSGPRTSARRAASSGQGWPP